MKTKWVIIFLFGIIFLPVAYSQTYSVDVSSTSLQGGTVSGSTYEARTSLSSSSSGNSQGSTYQASVGYLGEPSSTSASSGIDLGEGSGSSERKKEPEKLPEVQKPVEPPKLPVVKKISFTVSPSTIKVSLKQGDTQIEQITITNPSSEEIEVTLNKEGLGKFLLISEPYIKLAPEEIKKVDVLFTASVKEPADVHSGFIQINSGDIKKTIPVIIEILAKEALFDIKSSITKNYQEVSPGQEVSVDFDLLNFGDLRPVDVILTYSLRDMSGKTLWSQQETFAVETTKKVTMNIKIPKSTPEGSYQIYGRIDYKGEYATTAVLINVLSKPKEETPLEELPKKIEQQVKEMTITREKSRLEMPASIIIILALVSVLLSIGTVIYTKKETIDLSRVNKSLFNIKTLFFVLIVLGAGLMAVFGLPSVITDFIRTNIKFETIFTWTNMLLAILVILFILIILQLGRIKKAIIHSYSTKPKFHFRIESERKHLNVLPKIKNSILFVNENILVYLLKKIWFVLKGFFFLLLKLLIVLEKYGKEAVLTVSEDIAWLVKSTKQRLIEKYRSAKAERAYQKQIRKNRLEISVAKQSKVLLPIKPIIEPIYGLISSVREINRMRKVAAQCRLASRRNRQLQVQNFRMPKINYLSEYLSEIPVKIISSSINLMKEFNRKRNITNQCRLASRKNQQLRIRNFKMPEIKTPVTNMLTPIIRPKVIERAIYRMHDRITEAKIDKKDELDRRTKIDKIKALYEGKKED